MKRRSSVLRRFGKFAAEAALGFLALIVLIVKALYVFVLMPAFAFALFGKGAENLVENHSVTVQLVILLLLSPLVVGLIQYVTSEDNIIHELTRKFDPILGEWIVLSNLVYFFALMLPYFSGLSCTLKSAHLIKTVPDFAVSDDCIVRFSAFYIWHFLDAIPLLKIPQTMQWTAPHQYTEVFSGFMLLLFKVGVIFPFIKAYGLWLKNRKKKEAEKEATPKATVRAESGLTTAKP